MTAAHIVPVPPFFFFLRIAQLVFTFIVFIVAAYGVSVSDAVYSANDYALFVSMASFIILGYYLITSIWCPRGYNRWAVLVLEVFANTWWLGAWASLAAWAAAPPSDVVVIWKRSDDLPKGYRSAMAAGAGLGAINWILFIVTLVVYSVNLHRHRMSGAPAKHNGKNRQNVEAQAGSEPLTYREEFKYESQSGAPQASTGLMH